MNIFVILNLYLKLLRNCPHALQCHYTLQCTVGIQSRLIYDSQGIGHRRETRGSAPDDSIDLPIIWRVCTQPGPKVFVVVYLSVLPSSYRGFKDLSPSDPCLNCWRNDRWLLQHIILISPCSGPIYGEN